MKDERQPQSKERQQNESNTPLGKRNADKLKSFVAPVVEPKGSIDVVTGFTF